MNKNQNKIEIDSVSEITPHNEALYEAGKKLLIEAISTGREFCKFMISISTGAIPVYMGLISFIIPTDYVAPASQINYSILPPMLFFISSVFFTIGYFPKSTNFSLDVIEEIKNARDKIIKKRMHFIWIGMVTFSFGVLLAIIIGSCYLKI